MKRDILPKGLNHKDIWGTFSEAHRPTRCEHCGNSATSRNLIASRRFYGMDLCGKCYHKKFKGVPGHPKEDIEPDDITKEYGEPKDLPF